MRDVEKPRYLFTSILTETREEGFDVAGVSDPVKLFKQWPENHGNQKVARVEPVLLSS